MNTNSIIHISDQKIEVDFIHSFPHRLFIKMPKEQEIWRRQVKSVAGRQWHPDLKLWSIPYCKDTVRHFHGMFREVAQYNFTINANIPDRYIPQPKEKPKYDSKKGRMPTIIPKYDVERTRLKEQLIVMRYSHTTIKSYQTHFKAFIYHYNDVPPSAITEQQIMQYMLYVVQKKKLAQGTQGQIINAIKFYYEKVLKQPKKTYYLKHPKKQKRLPGVLSEQEVSRLLVATENIKHRCILMLMYSAGLRIGEVVKLQIYDIKSDEGCILIREAKGKKDRYTLLAPKLLHWLRAYFKIHRPQYWLFEGEYGGQYSQSSIQKIFTAAKKKSKVNPHATTHTLRHSFATHLVHRGVNLRYIQELLGHNSSKTTEIYTHIAQSDYKKIQSPLENLNLDF